MTFEFFYDKHKFDLSVLIVLYFSQGDPMTTTQRSFIVLPKGMRTNCSRVGEKEAYKKYIFTTIEAARVALESCSELKGGRIFSVKIGGDYEPDRFEYQLPAKILFALVSNDNIRDGLVGRIPEKFHNTEAEALAVKNGSDEYNNFVVRSFAQMNDQIEEATTLRQFLIRRLKMLDAFYFRHEGLVNMKTNIPSEVLDDDVGQNSLMDRLSNGDSYYIWIDSLVYKLFFSEDLHDHFHKQGLFESLFSFTVMPRNPPDDAVEL